MELTAMPAHRLQKLMRRREISAEELALAVFNRIDEVEDKVKAYITLTRDKALTTAREVDRLRAAGEYLGPLAGIPIAVKDNICTRGLKTTCASRMLENFVPPYDATVTEKFKAARMVLVGKANMDEFAMGSSNENSAFFPTTNPVDPRRVPGGSSGGSAAAVAAGEAVVALGSDTGGSIRLPASFCGVVGMKPTYGAVSRYGLVAYASSLDQIGPLTKDVTDCALMLNVICGHDRRDTTSVRWQVPDYTSFLTPEIKGMRVGLPVEYLGEGIDPAVRKVILGTADKLASLGAEVAETQLPHTRYALPAYYLIATAEASSNLARYDGVKYGLRANDAEDMVDMYIKTRSRGFGTEVKRRIMLGTYALSAGYYDAYYMKALKVRTLIKQDFDRAFTRFDVLLSPTGPTTAFRAGEKTDDPLQMYMVDVCTLAVNLAGIPGISLPAGEDGKLPIGVQLMGRPFGEGDLLRIAYAIEQLSVVGRQSSE